MPDRPAPSASSQTTRARRAVGNALRGVPHVLNRAPTRRNGTIAVFLLVTFTLTGCFRLPDPPAPRPKDALAQRVRAALAGRKADALTYAGLYAVLADRFERRADATTAEAAAVAGRAADALAVPGVLKDVVNDELNPLIGKPQPVTPELAAQAAAKLRALSLACREAAR